MGYFVDNNFKLKLVDLTNDDSVASGGGTNTQTLQAEAGYVYEVIFINVYIPKVGTANTHNLRIYYQNITNDSLLYCSSTFNADISIGRNGIQFAGDDSELPANAREQFNIHNKMLYASNTQPIDFLYTNSTDVNQTGTRTIEVMVKEYKEAI